MLNLDDCGADAIPAANDNQELRGRSGTSRSILLRQIVVRDWWPQLHESLQSAVALEVPVAQLTEQRKPEEMIQEVVANTRSISNVVESLAARLEIPGPQKPIQPQSFTAEPEILEATRTALSKLVDDVDADVPGGNLGMESAVEGWREVAANPQATLEALNEAIRSAKGLRAYLDR